MKTQYILLVSLLSFYSQVSASCTPPPIKLPSGMKPYVQDLDLLLPGCGNFSSHNNDELNTSQDEEYFPGAQSPSLIKSRTLKLLAIKNNKTTIADQESPSNHENEKQ